MPADKNNTGMMKSLFRGIFLGCSAEIPLFSKKTKRIHTHKGVFENIVAVMFAPSLVLNGMSCVQITMTHPPSLNHAILTTVGRHLSDNHLTDVLERIWEGANLLNK
ncbi:hypothetical protein [Dickeya fangzhongdai]